MQLLLRGYIESFILYYALVALLSNNDNSLNSLQFYFVLLLFLHGHLLKYCS